MPKKKQSKCLGSDYVFDQSKADRAIQFCETYIKHWKGKHAGSSFILLDWERKAITEIFGWVHKDTGLRRYRKAFIFIPRKNGKTFLVSAVALYMLLADGESAPEVYTVASDRDQARLIHDNVRAFVTASKPLADRIKVYKYEAQVPKNNGRFKSLSSESASAHGLNPSAVIIDEVWTQRDWELIEAFETAVGARSQPLIMYVTTAGQDKESPCGQLYEYACGVRDGRIADPTFLPIIFEADESLAWDDPEAWYQANPSLGDTITEDTFQAEIERCKTIPSARASFERLHLNRWIQAEGRWIEPIAWDSCGIQVSQEDWLTQREGQECYIGLDLSSTQDLTAVSVAFPTDDGFEVASFGFIPADTMAAKVKTDKVPYNIWQRDGWLNVCPGPTVDHKQIEEFVLSLAERFKIAEIVYDRWQAAGIISSLASKLRGTEMVQFGQGFRSMNPACKEFERLLLEKKIVHNSNPLLSWCVGNASVERDAADNIKLTKSRSVQRIDLLVALVMAISRASVNRKPRSVYAERGMRSL